ncbi:MAG TPA: DUF4174 domain-containing protein [Rhizobiaceae bacterium]|nr:DUF4174 domain-containing protein [Rhizobiaceae bacterium]
MKRLLGMFIALLIAAPAVPASANPLESLQGKKRAVLLFARSRSDASLDRQMAMLGEQRTGFDQRKTVVFNVAGGREPMTFIGFASLPFGAGRDLQTQFAPASQGLTVVLVGLDGTEKGRWQHPVNPQVLFDLIDSMPIRQEEANKPTIVN